MGAILFRLTHTMNERDFSTTTQGDSLEDIRTRFAELAKEAGVEIKEGAIITRETQVDDDGWGLRSEMAVFVDYEQGVHIYPTTYRGKNSWIAQIGKADYKGINTAVGHGEDSMDCAIRNALTALVELRLSQVMEF